MSSIASPAGLLSSVRTKKPTFGEILDGNRGLGPGFDVLRIALAFAILYGHTKWVAGTGHAVTIVQTVDSVGEIWAGLSRPWPVSKVPMFFALSGFLVLGSAFRSRSIYQFLGLRGLRIFPALIVEVLLSAFVLGVVFTTLPLESYFASPTFWRYLANCLGIVSYELPGIFASNPVPFTVNASLWTLPSEFYCYLITALLMAVGILYDRRVFTLLYAITSVVFIALNTVSDFSVTPRVLSVENVVFYFLTGCLFFHWRDRIPFSWPLFLAASALSFVLLISPHTNYVAPVFLTYVTIFIGMIKFPKIPLLSTGDYSYGVYLFSFPISQGLMAAIPSLAGHFYQLLILTVLTTSLFAAFSWHVVEKNALKFKVYLKPRAARREGCAPSGPSADEAGTEADRSGLAQAVVPITSPVNSEKRLAASLACRWKR